MADKRPAPFSLRLTFEQRAQLEQDAGGMSLAAYIQSRLFDSENPAPRRRGKRPVKDSQALAQAIGRAHVCTPVTNAQLVCRLLLAKKKTPNSQDCVCSTTTKRH